MNCRRVQKLIPLYVEGDLAFGAAERLTSHLEWCSRCNWLADEYKESQSWLRSSETPLSDEFLAEFKRDVLKQVSTIDSRPSLLASLAQQWNRRQVLAICAAVMIVLGTLLLYFTQRAGGHGQMTEATRQTQDNQRNQDYNNARPPDSGDVPKQAPPTSSVARHIASRRHPIIRQASPELLSTRVVEQLRPETASNPEQLLPVSGPSDSGDMLRIEIQTADPNIRIIWFAPRETNSNQNKPATD